MTEAIQLIGRFVAVILNPTIALLFGFALLVFLWGLAKFIWTDSENQESDREEGRRHMLWGIVGMFIMIAAFGITSIIVNTFGISSFSGGGYGGGSTYPFGNTQNLTPALNQVTGGGANNDTPLFNRTLGLPTTNTNYLENFGSPPRYVPPHD